MWTKEVYLQYCKDYYRKNKEQVVCDKCGSKVAKSYLNNHHTTRICKKNKVCDNHKRTAERKFVWSVINKNSKDLNHVFYE